MCCLRLHRGSPHVHALQDKHIVAQRGAPVKLSLRVETMKCTMTAVHMERVMATEPRRNAKSESLTIRLDPKTRFVLEFMSRLRGQTITTVVERAIYDAADNIRNFGSDTPDWQQLWDISEGVRTIRVAKDKRLYPTYEEDQLVGFIDVHWEFFYTSMKHDTPRRGSVDILWPNIKEYLEEWNTSRNKDYFGVGKKMAKALSQAGVKAPDWPRGTPQPAPLPAKTMTDEIDDDIPF